MKEIKWNHKNKESCHLGSFPQHKNFRSLNVNERNIQKCKYLYAHANIKRKSAPNNNNDDNNNNNDDDDDDDDDDRNRNNKHLLDQERNWEPEKEPLGTRVSLP